MFCWLLQTYFLNISNSVPLYNIFPQSFILNNIYIEHINFEIGNKKGLYTEKNGCLELTSGCLTMGQPSYMFSCNI